MPNHKNNKGYKKMLTGKKLTKRFFSYLNCSIIITVMSICCNLIPLITNNKIKINVVIYMLSMTLFYFSRFLLIYDTVITKNK